MVRFSRRHWKRAATFGFFLFLGTSLLDLFLTLRQGHLYHSCLQPVDDFADKVFEKVAEFRTRDREGNRERGDGSNRVEGTPLTALTLVGLSKEEITRPLRMPQGFSPTLVFIYDTNQLIGLEGYLIEWDQWGTERLGWQPRWYTRRWSLTVETVEQSYHLWGFGVLGNVFLTNVSLEKSEQLAQEFARPLPNWERIYRVRYDCPDSLKGKVDWAVFDGGAFLQIHYYDEIGKHKASVGFFSDYEKAKNAVLFLWAGNNQHRVSFFKVSVFEKPSRR